MVAGAAAAAAESTVAVVVGNGLAVGSIGEDSSDPEAA